MLSDRVEKSWPVTNKGCDPDCDQENDEISFVEEAKPREQTDKERIAHLMEIFPADSEIEKGTATDKARNRYTPVEDRHEKKCRIERKQPAGNYCRAETEPASSTEHQKE